MRKCSFGKLDLPPGAPKLDALYAYCVQAVAAADPQFRKAIGAQMRIVEGDDQAKGKIAVR